MISNLLASCATESPRRLEIAAGDVHVWQATDGDVAADWEYLHGLLEPSERARADAYRFDADRRRFVFCRGALRHLLGEYLGVSGQTIELAVGAFQKPALAGDSPLRFNVSHTPGMSLLVFSTAGDVGVDVEAMGPSRDWQGIARRFFHPAESEWLAAAPPAERVRLACRLWTCKEAYLKAVGIGLSGDLASFAIRPTGENAEAVIRFSPHTRMNIRQLEVGAGFAAALAVLGRPGVIHRRLWSGN